MKLRATLDEIKFRYSFDIKQVAELTQETCTQLAARLQYPALQQELCKLSDQEREEYLEHLRNTLEAISEDPESNIELPPLVSRTFWATLQDHTIGQRLRFLLEMALIYVVTLMEAFTKEYLLCLYTENVELLKSSKAMTFEEILSFDDTSQLHYALAEREIDQVSYKSIDQLADYLNSKFKLGISEDLGWWSTCREASYRRNLVVHNRGIVNSVYISKIGNSPENGTRLSVSIHYVHNVSEAIQHYISFLHTSLTEKLGVQ